MSAALSDLVIEQGATFQIALNFNGPTQSDGTMGDPIDVSAWIFSGQIRSNYSSTVDIQNFSFAMGLQTNQVVASISAANTALIVVRPTQNYQITASNYAYDIFATLPDLTVQKILMGPVSIVPRVTQ